MAALNTKATDVQNVKKSTKKQQMEVVSSKIVMIGLMENVLSVTKASESRMMIASRLARSL